MSNIKEKAIDLISDISDDIVIEVTEEGYRFKSTVASQNTSKNINTRRKDRWNENNIIGKTWILFKLL